MYAVVTLFNTIIDYRLILSHNIMSYSITTMRTKLHQHTSNLPQHSSTSSRKSQTPKIPNPTLEDSFELKELMPIEFPRNSKWMKGSWLKTSLNRSFMRVSCALNKLMWHNLNEERDKYFMEMKFVYTIFNVRKSWKQSHENPLRLA